MQQRSHGHVNHVFRHVNALFMVAHQAPVTQVKARGLPDGLHGRTFCCDAAGTKKPAGVRSPRPVPEISQTLARYEYLEPIPVDEYAPCWRPSEAGTALLVVAWLAMPPPHALSALLMSCKQKTLTTGIGS